MTACQKAPETMAEDSKRKTRSADSADTPSHVLIDYRGMIGRPKGKKPVPHRMSPVLAFWPEPGKMNLELQPGFNRIDADLWRHYAANHPQIREKVRTGQIREITAEQPDDLVGLIERSYCKPSLEWLRERLVGKMATADEHEVDQNKYAIAEIDRRLAIASPVVVGPMPWGGAPGYIPGRSNQTPMGMG